MSGLILSSLSIDLILLGVGIVTSAGVLLLGIIVGTYREKKHLKSLAEREAIYQGFLIHDLKNFPALDSGLAPVLVHGEAVIASDRFKAFIAKWVKFFGGEISVYSTMMERARREATMRMIADAEARGYNAIANVRLEAVDIGGLQARQQQQNSVQCSAMAYGTAYRKL